MYTKLIKCPSCEQLLKTTRNKCPFCGFEFVKRSAVDGLDFFSSTDIREPPKESVQRFGKYADHNVVMRGGDEVFSSSKRAAANGGYTQQNTNAGKERTYYGVEADVSGDREYFSSKKRDYGFVDVKPKERAVVPDTEVFFSSSKRLAETPVNEKTVSEDPEANPYDGKSVLSEPPEITEHSTEYVAHNLVEFTKHRFAKPTADRIEILLASFLAVMVLFGAVSLYFEQTHLYVFVTLAYMVIMLALAFGAIKTFSDFYTKTMSFVTIVFSAFVIVMHLVFLRLAGAVNTAIILAPVVAMNVLSLRLTKRMIKLRKLWDAYVHREEDVEAIDHSTLDYDIY